MVDVTVGESLVIGNKFLSLVPAVGASTVVFMLVFSARRRLLERASNLNVGTHQPAQLSIGKSTQTVVAALGQVVRGVLGRPHDYQANQLLGGYILAALATALLEPFLALLVVVGATFHSVMQRRARTRRAHQELVDELPEIVDLLVLAVSAGLSVPLALEVVARRGEGVVAKGLRQATQSALRGASLPEALSNSVQDLGETVRPLMSALAGSLRDGTSVLPGLERLSAQVRIDRRRQAEEQARKLPVKLLFPLVVCILPAFGLLSVVPLLVTGLNGLSF